MNSCRDFATAIPVDEEALEKSLRPMERTRYALFIVAYNVEKHIFDVLERIPEEMRDGFKCTFGGARRVRAVDEILPCGTVKAEPLRLNLN